MTNILQASTWKCNSKTLIYLGILSKLYLIYLKVYYSQDIFNSIVLCWFIIIEIVYIQYFYNFLSQFYQYIQTNLLFHLFFLTLTLTFVLDVRRRLLCSLSGHSLLSVSETSDSSGLIIGSPGGLLVDLKIFVTFFCI